MEIKRNIFESRGNMTADYEPAGVPVTMKQINPTSLVGLEKSDMNVRHAPIPRIGDQK